MTRLSIEAYDSVFSKLIASRHFSNYYEKKQYPIEKNMITIHVTQDDLAGVRFAYRPLLEISLSYRILSNPAFQSPFLRWTDEAYPALHDLDLPFLAAMVTPAGYIP